MRGKKGVSVVIGYVILVAVAITMSFLVYAWMKSYVPKEELKCPDDVSIRILNTECITGGTFDQIKIEIKNTGLFNIEGYILNGKDMNDNLIGISGGNYFSGIQVPNSKISLWIGSGTEPSQTITSIEITPLRYQEDKETGKNQTAICTDAIVTRSIPDCTILPGKITQA